MRERKKERGVHKVNLMMSMRILNEQLSTIIGLSTGLLFDEIPSVLGHIPETNIVWKLETSLYI